MASRTAQDLVDELRRLVGSPSTSEASDALLLTWVNDAYVDVVAGHRCPEFLDVDTLTTAASTEDYELAVTDDVFIEEVFDSTSGNRLESIDLASWVRKQGSSAQPGAPQKYLLYGVGDNGRRQFRLFPVPDAVYSIKVYHFAEPTELVLSPAPTSILLPRQYDRDVLSRASLIGNSALQNHDAAVRDWQLMRPLRRTVAMTQMTPDERGDMTSRMAGELWEQR